VKRLACCRLRSGTANEKGVCVLPREYRDAALESPCSPNVREVGCRWWLCGVCTSHHATGVAGNISASHDCDFDFSCFGGSGDSRRVSRGISGAKRKQAMKTWRGGTSKQPLGRLCLSPVGVLSLVLLFKLLASARCSSPLVRSSSWRLHLPPCGRERTVSPSFQAWQAVVGRMPGQC